MDKPTFVYVTYVATTPQKLWDALTRGEFTKRYWYGRRIESTWDTGAPVTFYDRDTDVRTDSGIVVEADPPRRLTYTFRPEMSDEFRALGFSRVSFIIEPKDDIVKLTLVHDELPSQELADAFREGWAPILSSLKTFLETGRPLSELRELVEQGRPR